MALLSPNQITVIAEIFPRKRFIKIRLQKIKKKRRRRRRRIYVMYKQNEEDNRARSVRAQ